MSGQFNQKKIPSKGSTINNLALRIRLIIRLMGDSRVNPLLKLLPIGSLLYLILPDFMLGPIDDVIVLWLGSYLFIELCPSEVVNEHLFQLTGTINGKWHDPSRANDDIIEGEFHEPKE